MKLTDLILKITALVLAVAAIACLIMANMERISDWMACLWAKVQAKKELLCRTCPCEGCESDDEFEEWISDRQPLLQQTGAALSAPVFHGGGLPPSREERPGG
ncbi:MAG: hypothetical protein ACLUHN_05470 [Evtepia gabavorous]